MHILIISTYGFDSHFPSRPEFLLARTLATIGHRVSAVEYHHNPKQPRQESYSENLTIYRCGTFGFFHVICGNSRRRCLLQILCMYIIYGTY